MDRPLRSAVPAVQVSVVEIGHVRVRVHHHLRVGVAMAVPPDERHAVVVVVVVGVGVLVVVNDRFVAVHVIVGRVDRPPPEVWRVLRGRRLRCT
jgi:hypothetical protein